MAYNRRLTLEQRISRLERLLKSRTAKIFEEVDYLQQELEWAIDKSDLPFDGYRITPTNDGLIISFPDDHFLNDRYYEITSGENEHFYKVLLHEYDEPDELGEADSGKEIVQLIEDKLDEAVYGDDAW